MAKVPTTGGPLPLCKTKTPHCGRLGIKVFEDGKQKK